MEGVVVVDVTSSEDEEWDKRLVRSVDPYVMEITIAVIVPKQLIRIARITTLVFSL